MRLKDYRITVFGILMLLTQVSWAQTGLLADTSETIVITARRQAVESFQLAESVSVLSREDLQHQVSRSTAEALIGTPGVWMQKTNHGGGSPFLRGLTGNQTLLLLDGIRLNNSTYRYGPNQYFNTISVLNIDRVEVVRGSGSVLYGSDALGGTINVLTRSPEFAKDQRRLKMGLLGRFISRDMEQSGGANLEWSGQKIAVYSDYNYRNFGDLIAGGDLGKEAPSSYEEQAASAKIKAKVGGRSILTFAYNGVFQSEVGRYDQVAQRGYQIYEFEPQNRQLAYVRGESGSNQSLFKKVEWTASWQHSREGRNKQKEDSNIRQYELDEVTSFGLNFQVHSDLGPKLGLLSGVESYWDRINSRTEEQNLSSDEMTVKRGLYPDGSRAGNVAVYSSLTADLDRWRFNAGLRYNFFSLSPQDQNFGDTKLTPEALVGNFSAHYTIGDHHALLASASTAFRAPNINDLSSFGAFDFGLEVPTAELEPEKTLNLELGYKIQTTSTRAQLSIYRLQLHDLISRIRGTYQGQSVWQGEEVYIKANTSRAYIQGVEWDGSWNIHPKWLIRAAMTYTYGQDEEKDSPMRRIPPLNGSFTLRFQPAPSWGLAWQNWYAGKQDRLSGGDLSDHRIAEGGTPGWFVSNLNLSFTKDWLQLNGGIQNLFDEAYRMHGSGVDGVGRSLWLSLSMKWEQLFD